MNRADCKALRSAALELASWAKSLIDGYTTQDNDWGDDDRAKNAYEKHLRLIKRLRKIANAEQAKLPRRGRDARP